MINRNFNKPKLKPRKLKTVDIEIAVAEYMNPRQKLIVPNISWGMMLHECDLLVITGSGYAREIEIKVSKADLIKDKEKRHGHYSHKIKNLFFAIPDYLEKHKEHIPKRAGIITVSQNLYDGSLRCNTIREAENTSDYKFSYEEKYNVARLGAMRIWGLKKKVVDLRHRLSTGEKGE